MNVKVGVWQGVGRKAKNEQQLFVSVFNFFCLYGINAEHTVLTKYEFPPSQSHSKKEDRSVTQPSPGRVPVSVHCSLWKKITVSYRRKCMLANFHRQ